MKCPNCGEMNKFNVFSSIKDAEFPFEKVNKRHLICSQCGLNFETTEVVTQKNFLFQNLDPDNPNNINARLKAQLDLFNVTNHYIEEKEEGKNDEKGA